ncbi:thiamine transporter thia [Lactococcus hodotermopsidis]|uniref:Thiamine transporter thia n=1 Tax=Pseudolactococcus hodotermopsidis TaxID=2709157 RepID=A0A6A0BCG6_9LACT|nr:energy-coupled thiamine transporter ThiT [Lactococcus hodotermopsidis]GFH42048.1 thiamine transporter thia [Lactococcus hodotermopsidis]
MNTTTTAKVTDIRIWIEGAFMASLAMALQFIPHGIGFFSISLGAVPIALYALRRGTASGAMAGLVWGLLHFVVGKAWFLSVPQVLIEYVFAYLLCGATGLFANKIKAAAGNKNKIILYIILGALAGNIARYFLHFIAGVIFWSEYAWKGYGAVLYSVIINGTNGLLTAALTSIVLILVYLTYPKLFSTK